MIKVEQDIPMTETAYYILLSLTVARHGYGIIKFVDELTEGRIKLGSGTVYGTIKKMQRAGTIEARVLEGKTVYIATEAGIALLKAEINRIKLVYSDTIRQEGLIK